MADVCSICNGLGMAIVHRPDGSQFARECVCRVERRAARILETARIPRRYALCSLDNYETMQSSSTASLKGALLTTRKFVEGYPVATGGKGLLFTGSSGLGKTHLAIGALKQLIADKGATGVFWEHKELLENIRSIYGTREAGAESALLRSVITCDLLVLDDLGDITPTEWTWDTTSYILNSRYNQDRSTIITSNLLNEPPSIGFSGAAKDRFADHPGREVSRAMERRTLGDRIGERMHSRLQEMCMVVEMQGVDFRQKVKRAKFG